MLTMEKILSLDRMRCSLRPERFDPADPVRLELLRPLSASELPTESPRSLALSEPAAPAPVPAPNPLITPAPAPVPAPPSRFKGASSSSSSESSSESMSSTHWSMAARLPWRSKPSEMPAIEASVASARLPAGRASGGWSRAEPAIEKECGVGRAEGLRGPSWVLGPRRPEADMSRSRAACVVEMPSPSPSSDSSTGPRTIMSLWM